MVDTNGREVRIVDDSFDMVETFEGERVKSSEIRGPHQESFVSLGWGLDAIQL